ncbi:Citrate synthase 2 [Nymphaea thermarum]|nr:Citrate synthase 2 [Nymphaea thermarum]
MHGIDFMFTNYEEAGEGIQGREAIMLKNLDWFIRWTVWPAPKKNPASFPDKGTKLYDPGYLYTAPVRSSISYIVGEVAYLLSEQISSLAFLPLQSQSAEWEFVIAQHSVVPQGILDIIHATPHDSHPMGMLVSAMGALSIFHPDTNPVLRGEDIYKSMQASTIAAAAYLRTAGRPPVIPSSNLSYTENLLYMLDSLGNKSYRPNPRLARVLDVLFILHAEHEMNCSTAAARHLASSGVDVHTALAGAVGALYGPLHGGAHEVNQHFKLDIFVSY